MAIRETKYDLLAARNPVHQVSLVLEMLGILFAFHTTCKLLWGPIIIRRCGEVSTNVAVTFIPFVSPF